MWRCWNPKKQLETSILTNSIFSKTQHQIQDVLVFFYAYIMKLSLSQAAQMSGFHYKTTAVKWASTIRDMCKIWAKDYVFDPQLKLSGVVEIDKSLFGRSLAQPGRPT